MSREQHTLGYTVLALGNSGIVQEVDRKGKVLWKIIGLELSRGCPGDCPLPRAHCGILQPHGVRTRFFGYVIWSKKFPTHVVNVQQLAIGHVFVTTSNQLVVLDRTGKELLAYKDFNNRSGAMLRDGRMVAWQNDHTLKRLDARGKPLETYKITANAGWTNGLDVTPRNSVVYAHHGEKEIIEVDAKGKVLWKTKAPNITTAIYPFPSTSFASHCEDHKVMEPDRTGRTA